MPYYDFANRTDNQRRRPGKLLLTIIVVLCIAGLCSWLIWHEHKRLHPISKPTPVAIATTVTQPAPETKPSVEKITTPTQSKPLDLPKQPTSKTPTLQFYQVLKQPPKSASPATAIE